MSSGSYIFSESYLYTEEAFDDFFAHVSDTGVISIIRFRFEPPSRPPSDAETARATPSGGRDPFVVLAKQEASGWRPMYWHLEPSSGDVFAIATALFLSGYMLSLKAAGGAKSYDDARAMIEAGATRIGASAGVRILQEASHAA